MYESLAAFLSALVMTRVSSRIAFSFHARTQPLSVHLMSPRVLRTRKRPVPSSPPSSYPNQSQRGCRFPLLCNAAPRPEFFRQSLPRSCSASASLAALESRWQSCPSPRLVVASSSVGLSLSSRSPGQGIPKKSPRAPHGFRSRSFGLECPRCSGIRCPNVCVSPVESQHPGSGRRSVSRLLTPWVSAGLIVTREHWNRLRLRAVCSRGFGYPQGVLERPSTDRPGTRLCTNLRKDWPLAITGFGPLPWHLVTQVSLSDFDRSD
jgi:hypothetical protein